MVWFGGNEKRGRSAYAYESECTSLLDLAMHNVITAGDIDESRVCVASGVDVVCDDLSTEPVAVVVCVAEIHYQGHVAVEYAFDGSDCANLAIVVSCVGEGCTYCSIAFGIVDVCADGFLHFRCIEVVDIVRRREWVRHDISNVIFISFCVDVKEVLCVLIAPVISSRADAVPA